MKTQAAVLREMGKLRPYAESVPLEIEELDLSGPGPGQVLVEVAYAAICQWDLSVVNGTRPRATPIVLGHEASGVIRELGPGSRDLREGDHVVFSYIPSCGRCVFCASGRPGLCEQAVTANSAGTLIGGDRNLRSGDGQEMNHMLGLACFSQYTVVAAESVLKLDELIPLDTAALFGCALLAGVGAVINTARVEAGMSVAVFGLGSVGLSAVMGAKAAGAWPIVVVDVLREKLALAVELGATHVVNPELKEPVAAVREATDGGVQFALECVGSEILLSQAYGATRRGGMTVAAALSHPSRTFAVPAMSLVAEERTIKGSYMGSSVPNRDIPRFLALYRAGRLPLDRLVLDTTTLDDINPALDAVASGKATRQLVHVNAGR